MVNHSSTLAWKIPWTEEPILLFTYVHWVPEETYTFSVNGTQEWHVIDWRETSYVML